MKRIFTFITALCLCATAFAQPVTGTTLFNSAPSTPAPSGPSPQSATLEGWNIKIESAINCAITHPAGTLVLVSTPVVTGLWQQATFSSSNGSEFSLQNFTFKGVTASFLAASFTVTGYRNGSPVPGAVYTTLAIGVLNTYYNIDFTYNTGFLNIDEFRITPTILNVQGNLTMDDITVGPPITTLPMIWTAPVTAVPSNGKVLVKWSVENIPASCRFVVEHSSNGTSFTELATINATAARNYSYTDTRAADGKNYYRIRETDADGKFSNSNTAMVQMNAGEKMSVYPNPATSKITISNVPVDATLQLIDNSGRILLTQPAGSTNNINIARFPAGLYLVKVKGAKESVQFIKE